MHPTDRPAAERELAEGRAHAAAGRLDEATHSFERAIRNDPAWPEPALQLGIALEGAHRFGAAIEAYERCLELDRKSTAARTRIGDVHRKAGRYLEAIDAYDGALDVESAHLPALTGKAECLRLLHRALDAVEVFDRALAIAPDHAPATHGRAAALQTVEHHGSVDGALVDEVAGMLAGGPLTLHALMVRFHAAHPALSGRELLGALEVAVASGRVEDLGFRRAGREDAHHHDG